MKGFGIPVSNWQEELKLEESRAHTRRRFFFVYFCEKENCADQRMKLQKSPSCSKEEEEYMGH